MLPKLDLSKCWQCPRFSDVTLRIIEEAGRKAAIQAEPDTTSSTISSSRDTSDTPDIQSDQTHKAMAMREKHKEKQPQQQQQKGPKQDQQQQQQKGPKQEQQQQKLQQAKELLLPCSSAILAAGSEYFHTRLLSELEQEGRIELTLVVGPDEADIASAVIQSLYTGLPPDASVKQLLRIFIMADQLQATSADLCVEALQQLPLDAWSWEDVIEVRLISGPLWGATSRYTAAR